MTKKVLNQNTKLDQELFKIIKSEFNFSNKPLNRFKIIKENKSSIDTKGKIKLISDLKNQINSIVNCNLKLNSKNLLMGDGDIDSAIMLIGEAPSHQEDLTGKSFQGDVGKLLDKMLLAINIKRENIYST